MKKTLSAIITILFLSTALISCASKQVSEEDNLENTWITNNNEQLSQHPMMGFGYKSSRISKRKWKNWINDSIPIVRSILKDLPKGYVLQVTGHCDASGPEEKTGKKGDYQDELVGKIRQANEREEMRKTLLFILLIVFLSTINYGLWTALAEEEKLTLNISVANPSDEVAQDVEVKVDLPQELKKGDIVSSDGLKIVFNTEKGCLTTEGNVLLQPAEATIYKIVVKDVWSIQEREIASLRSSAARYLPQTEILNRLDKILASQRESAGDVRAHIAAYRENSKELEKIKEELRIAGYASDAAKGKGQRVIWLAVLAAILGAGIFIGRRRLILWIRGYMQKEKAS